MEGMEDFEARWYAETLARAEEIKRNPMKMAAAREVMPAMVQEKRAEMEGLMLAQRTQDAGGPPSFFRNLLEKFPSAM